MPQGSRKGLISLLAEVKLPTMIKYLALSLCLLLTACARSPIKGPDNALRVTQKDLSLSDDLHLKSLVKGLIQSVRQLQRAPNLEMTFGSSKITQGEYAKALEELIAAIAEFKSKNEFYDYVEKNWQFKEVYGRKDWGEVFITSYFDPVIEGSLKPTKKFSQPLYKAPEDMVLFDIGAYAERFEKWDRFLDEVLEQKSRKPIVRGRIVEQGKFKKIVPYYDRKEIDEEKSLAKQKLEIVYVDPIDSFFLQIQGSGIVRLQNGKEIRVGYAAQNGHPYVAIGRHLLDKIPLEKMSLQSIEEHLRTLPPQEMQAVLNLNPSYVFFQELEGPSQTFFQTDVVAGRTIATDYGFFPKGSMAFLKFPKPQFEDGQTQPEKFKTTSRFVVDHDTGGAIRGPGRLDLYWGKGEEAKKHAGVMRHEGELYYLFPKVKESQVAENSNGG